MILLLTALSSFAAPSQFSASELPAALAAIHASEAESKLIVGTTWDTNGPVKDIIAAHPELHGEVRRVPEIPSDAEDSLTAALARAGLRCGVWIGLASTDRYVIHEVGTCKSSSVPERAPRPPVAVTSPPAPSSAPQPVGTPSSVGSAPQTVAPPPPAPPPVPRFGADEKWALTVQLTAPDPTTAMLQSTLIGFGAGHFYCNDRSTGYAHLGTQLGGIALASIGAALSASGNGGQGGPIAQSAGIAVLAFSRVVEVATVPYAARKEARRMVEQR